MLSRFVVHCFGNEDLGVLAALEGHTNALALLLLVAHSLSSALFFLLVDYMMYVACYYLVGYTPDLAEYMQPP